MPRREDCALRPLQERDLPTLLQWRNAERIRACLFTDHVISAQEHRAWYDRLSQESQAANLVFELQGRPVGMVSFAAIDPRNGTCRWGYYLGETGVPRGTGTALGFLGLIHAFGELGIRKLSAEVFAFNTASVRFLQRLGFVQEGRLVRQALKGGVFEDVLVFALFDEDWRTAEAGLERRVFRSADEPAADRDRDGGAA